MSRLTELLMKANKTPWRTWRNQNIWRETRIGSNAAFADLWTAKSDNTAALIVALANNAEKFQALWDAASKVVDFDDWAVSHIELESAVEELRDLMGDGE